MSVTVIGLDGVQYQGRRQHWSRELGRQTIDSYNGPPDKTQAYYETFINSNDVDDVQWMSGMAWEHWN